MTATCRFGSMMAVAIVGPLAVLGAGGSGDMDRLVAAYMTQPDEYPTGANVAQPDISVPFRWTRFNDTVQRHADAKMNTLVVPFNPVEGEGVTVGDGCNMAYVAEHVTQGKQALKVDITADAIKAWHGSVTFEAKGGPRFKKTYAMTECKVSEFWPHFRRLRMDIFNAGGFGIHARILDVPFVIHPGSNDVVVRVADVGGTRITTDGLVQNVNFAIADPVKDVTLYFDNVRMETETPALIGDKGRMFQFTTKAIDHCYPGFTPVDEGTAYSAERKFGWTGPDTPKGGENTFYSQDNSLLKFAYANDGTFRVDLPDGAYGIHVLARPGDKYDWGQGARMKVNGEEQVVVAPRTPAEAAAMEAAAETFDYRPGQSLFESRMRETFYPVTQLARGVAKDGHLLLEFPPNMPLSAVIIFPEADKEEALKEIGRLYYAIAESWELTRPWLKIRKLESTRYVGLHEELLKPDSIPGKLKALNLTDADFKRGFITFVRGITEGVYQDTVPSPEEAGVKELKCLAAPGQRECVNFGLLPLAEKRGIKVTVGELAGKDGAKIPASALDLRCSRYQPKYRVFRRHNTVDYNFQEHYLGHRESVDVYPVDARRVYLDVAVPADAKAGEYEGRIAIAGADGAALAAMPVTLEVLPLALDAPKIYLGTQFSDPLLKEFGLNSPSGLGDVASLPVHGFSQPLTPGDVASFVGKSRQLGGMDAKALEEARQSEKGFCVIDGTQNSKEQFARFTFGVWLWRSGATARYTILGSFAGGNAIHPADFPVFRVSDQETWYSRDLLLVREGIDDYRHLVTLQNLLKKADENKTATPQVASARKFLDDLTAQVSLDLAKYYEIVPGGYMENKYALPGNPWTGAKFNDVRRECAKHILALRAER